MKGKYVVKNDMTIPAGTFIDVIDGEIYFNNRKSEKLEEVIYKSEIEPLFGSLAGLPPDLHDENEGLTEEEREWLRCVGVPTRTYRPVSRVSYGKHPEKWITKILRKTERVGKDLVFYYSEDLSEYGEMIIVDDWNYGKHPDEDLSTTRGLFAHLDGIPDELYYMEVKE